MGDSSWTGATQGPCRQDEILDMVDSRVIHATDDGFLGRNTAILDTD